MANLRFPSNVESSNRPHIVFSTHRATYEKSSAAYNVVRTGDSVALYMPTNYGINDVLQYDNESTGIVGNVFERLSGGNGISMKDVVEVGEAAAAEYGFTAGAAGAAAAAGSGVAGKVVATLAAAGVAGNIKSENAKSYQKTLNPRNFILFKSPTIRQFGFNFTFIPSNEKEANDVPEIIKFFRKASYPKAVGGDIQYQFPLGFTIKVTNSDNIIKIPEVVCIGTSITYNPNSMSYFAVNNFPVEVVLQLSFQELQPIDNSLIDEGF
jgi:hypothetical protein